MTTPTLTIPENALRGADKLWLAWTTKEGKHHTITTYPDTIRFIWERIKKDCIAVAIWDNDTRVRHNQSLEK